MGRHTLKRLLLLIALVILALGGLRTVLAAGGYDLSRWTVAGGGRASSGTGYNLSGAAGQPAAGELSGSGFHLSSGFWVGGGMTSSEVYLPLIVK